MTQTKQREKNKRLKSDIYFNTCYIAQKMSNKLYLENVYTLKKVKSIVNINSLQSHEITFFYLKKFLTIYIH